MTSLLCRSLVRNLVITVPQETPAVYFIQCRGKRKGPPGAKTYAYDLKQPELPEPSHAFRRRVHFPEEYTVKPLSVTRLGGRDPVSGRKVVKGIGGGIKYKHHWIDWQRVGPKEGPPLVERVIQIMDDFRKTARIALVATDKEMKYYLATENMKPGDLIRTSMHIPRIPVSPQEGDAHPLGALPLGTQVNCVEKYTGCGAFYSHAAGTYCTIMRRVGDRVIVQLPSKIEVSLPMENMAVVGRLSNVDHHKEHIGSAQRNRELGNRPRSGWWQRKTPRFGRKIRPPPPVKIIEMSKPPKPEPIILTLDLKRKDPLVL